MTTATPPEPGFSKPPGSSLPNGDTPTPTSKAICLRAKSNLSAVNYHFGSRDALYMAVLEIAHTHMMSLDFLMQLAGSPVSPREKIERLVDGLILNLRNPRGWQLRLWAREVIFPTPLFAAGVARNVMPKVGIVHDLLGQYMQLPPDSPAVHCGVVSLMAPCMALLVADRDLKNSLNPGPAPASGGAGATHQAVPVYRAPGIHRGHPGRDSRYRALPRTAITAGMAARRHRTSDRNAPHCCPGCGIQRHGRQAPAGRAKETGRTEADTRPTSPGKKRFSGATRPGNALVLERLAIEKGRTRGGGTAPPGQT